MNKGQIFSIDFILAMILVVLFIGTILTFSETQLYSQKENILTTKLIKQTDAGLVALLNGKYSCQLESGINLANSLDMTTINAADESALKKYLGLSDKDVTLKIDGSFLKLNNTPTGDKTIILDQNILTCNGQVLISDLNNCLRSNNCTLTENKLSLEVS
ncbi:MAG: hypothetical protein WC915_03065 [archaeon]|jgi:hypothetical protein